MIIDRYAGSSGLATAELLEYSEACYLSLTRATQLQREGTRSTGACLRSDAISLHAESVSPRPGCTCVSSSSARKITANSVHARPRRLLSAIMSKALPELPRWQRRLPPPRHQLATQTQFHPASGSEYNIPTRGQSRLCRSESRPKLQTTYSGTSKGWVQNGRRSLRSTWNSQPIQSRLMDSSSTARSDNRNASLFRKTALNLLTGKHADHGALSITSGTCSFPSTSISWTKGATAASCRYVQIFWIQIREGFER